MCIVKIEVICHSKRTGKPTILTLSLSELKKSDNTLVRTLNDKFMVANEVVTIEANFIETPEKVSNITFSQMYVPQISEMLLDTLMLLIPMETK